jgi:hypothetical protein
LAIDETFLAEDLVVDVQDADVAGRRDAVDPGRLARPRRTIRSFGDGEFVILREVDPLRVILRLLREHRAKIEQRPAARPLAGGEAREEDDVRRHPARDRAQQSLPVARRIALGRGADDHLVLRVLALEAMHERVNVFAEVVDAPRDDFRPPVGGAVGRL